MFHGFWKKGAPFIGVSPMDGVTDAVFRGVIAQTAPASVSFTEFVNVEGLARGATSMLRAFLYDPAERPLVAQIYGIEEESFYKVAIMLCSLQVDGIDINMGCPAKKVAARGAGAGLIRNPEHAKRIVKMVQKGIVDWDNGITFEEADIRPKVVNALEKMPNYSLTRKMIPVSIKSRIGYDSIVAEEWVDHLLEVEPAAITLHGRTLKQMYTGAADWDVLGKVSQKLKNTETLFLGNGDITSLDMAHEYIKKYELDGVLIGRALIGNPWFFSGHIPTPEERKKKSIEHSLYYEKIFPEAPFFPMRRHLACYMKEFSGAKESRTRLMQANSSDDVITILS